MARQIRIYRESIELVRISREAVEALPGGHAYLADQLKRASSSVVLNFAEGFGRRTLKERRRFFDIATGSAHEVMAALDVGEALGIIEPATRDRGVDKASHIAAMLRRFR